MEKILSDATKANEKERGEGGGGGGEKRNKERQRREIRIEERKHTENMIRTDSKELKEE